MEIQLLKIADVELLHAATTRLKHLEFIDVDIYADDAVEDQVFYHPTNSLVAFSLQDFRPTYPADEGGIVAENVQILDNALANWIVYIGRKYPQLVDLGLNMDVSHHVEGGMVRHKELITGSLVTALRDMKCLKSYSVDFCSAAILDLMKANDVHLDHFEFMVDQDPDNQIAETITTIQGAQAVSTLSSLEFILIVMKEIFYLSAKASLTSVSTCGT